jgi:hypothetical protein
MMSLDKIALIIVIVAAGIYVSVMAFGIFASGVPLWPFFILLAIGIYLMSRVISDKLNNKEDKYYEDNIQE